MQICSAFLHECLNNFSPVLFSAEKVTTKQPSICFFNTLTRKKEVFKPILPGKVKMYTCGPTVYDFAHIGNFRAFLFEDLLKRWLIHRGFKVTHVMNLTDIDDKTIKGSQKQGVPLRQFTDFYVKAFFEDIKALNIEPADVYPKATDHIPEMVALIKTLMAKGYRLQRRRRLNLLLSMQIPRLRQTIQHQSRRTQSWRKSKPRRIRQRRSPRLCPLESMDA